MTKSPHPIDKHVGSRVRMRRKMLCMSQEKLADGLGLTFQQVQKYEKGCNRISASRLQQISQIVQVPVPFFFEGAPDVPGQPRGEREAPLAASTARMTGRWLWAVSAEVQARQRNCLADSREEAMAGFQTSAELTAS
jgi:transcriptional regulator with XRE-family HTH domain